MLRCVVRARAPVVLLCAHPGCAWRGVAQNDHLMRLRLAQHAENPDLTFRPRISEESHKLAVQRQVEDGDAGQTVTQRLSKAAEQRRRARALQQQAWQEKVRRHTAF